MGRVSTAVAYPGSRWCKVALVLRLHCCCCCCLSFICLPGQLGSIVAAMLQKQQMAQDAFSEHVLPSLSLSRTAGIRAVNSRPFEVEWAIRQASSAPATCCIACGATLPIAIATTCACLWNCSTVAISDTQDPWFQSDTDAPLPKENLARLVPGLHAPEGVVVSPGVCVCACV